MLGAVMLLAITLLPLLLLLLLLGGAAGSAGVVLAAVQCVQGVCCQLLAGLTWAQEAQLCGCRQ